MKYDRILRGGTVVDGTGAPGRRADLAMKDGRVFFPEADAEAEEILDVSGLTVCPGFIDIHSHSDICPLVPYLPESKLYQGATSELCGNCGISILPCNDERREEIENYCASELEIPMLGTKITTYSTAAYARHLEAHPMSTNYGMLVGHGTLRGAVMGFEDRPAAPEEMRRMEEILEQELLDGAFGMSLGLAYPPSCFAPPEELERLARVLARHDRLLTVHMRDEGAGVLDSVREMIGIAEKTGVHVQISHLKVMQKPNWKLFPEEMRLIDEANARGLRVTCDQYPYTASALALSALLPHYAHDGGIEAMLETVRRPDERLLRETSVKFETRGGANGVMVCSTRGVRPDWEGKFIGEIAEELGTDPLHAIMQILTLCGPEVFIITFAQDEKVVREVFSRPNIAVISDGYNLSYDPAITKDKLHPRCFSTFPHALAWARDEKLLPLETVIWKMTGLPARMMGLKTLGTLEEGKIADVTVFDPLRVKDRSTFTEPMQKPEGIEYVFVRGELIVDRGRITDARPGRALLCGTD